MQNLKSSRYFEGSDCCKIFQHDISALEAEIFITCNRKADDDAKKKRLLKCMAINSWTLEFRMCS
ncbi:hypothetical protein DPMN_004918 [Dreissena polymorpha]|uniref:Uncharacterized protein n=1 Tax=Dreissena polymorpha TaxID=45954 RepID=A0A9D4RW11_DREPO|nr:hypothetical protein DPMN_004918 [Dreissena polymorpha]